MKATFDKEFTSGLRRLAIPIIAQSLLSTAIGTADTLMLNVIGQTELSAVSLANNLSRILSNLFLGLIVGTSVLMAQYLSSAHREKINNVFSISCLVAGIACSTFFLLATLAPGFIMQLFTNDTALIRIGMQYLRIVGFSFLFMTFTQPYLVMLKAMRKPTKRMIISTTALVINLIFNAVFIFGLFGAPKLGVRGVAIATVKKDLERFLPYLHPTDDRRAHVDPGFFSYGVHHGAHQRRYRSCQHSLAVDLYDRTRGKYRPGRCRGDPSGRGSGKTGF